MPRKSRAELSVVPFEPDRLPSALVVQPPKHLGDQEKQIWRDVFADFELPTKAGLHVLTSALEAHQRARECREAISDEGLTVEGRDGQLRPHPLLAAERDARAAWLSGIRILGLEL
jgi:P27 family predicted phage terminase small subunit